MSSELTKPRHSQPEDCKPRWVADETHPKRGQWTPECPNLKEDGGGMEGERYHCSVCGYSYFLDYDDMR